MGDPTEQRFKTLEKTLDNIILLGKNGKYRLIKKYWKKYLESLQGELTNPNLKKINEIINWKE